MLGSSQKDKKKRKIERKNWIRPSGLRGVVLEHRTRSEERVVARRAFLESSDMSAHQNTHVLAAQLKEAIAVAATLARWLLRIWGVSCALGRKSQTVKT